MQAQSIQGQSIQGQSSASSDPVTTFAGTGRPLELPARCDPAVLALALAGPETLAVTTPTTLTVDLANPDGPCTLDLASHPIDVTITSGTDAIWSTTHCPSGLPTGAMQLSSTPVQFSLPWTVRRSAPGCSLSEAALKPGTYVATVAVKDGRSDRMVMRITG